MPLRLGIDTGGTYTDAVLIAADGTILHSAKSLTTHQDLVLGIERAVAGLPSGDLGEVGLVGLSTTLATNAIVEGKASRACTLMIGFDRAILTRSGLDQAIGADPVLFIRGGSGPGGFEATPLDEKALDAALQTIEADITGFAVIGAFAVRNPDHERRAAARVRTITGKPVTCSHELTTKLDGSRRALTTLFNARLIGRINDLLDAVAAALSNHGIGAPLMVVRGDGALFSVQSARLRPIETILSGPAASCVGAAWLTGLGSGFVSDVGGTTTDIGRIEKGRPKSNPDGASIAGHRTMVQAVGVTTVGLGGDSFIQADDGRIKIGPERALPLGRLAEQQPDILKTLQDQIARPEARPHDGVFATRHIVPDPLPKLSKSQAQLLELLSEQAQSFEELIERQRLGTALNHLIRRGWVLRSAMTPSDAAHLTGVTGALTLFDAEAPRLGAMLLRRSLRKSRLAGDDGIEGFARFLAERFEHETAASLTRFALAEDGLDQSILAGDAASALIGRMVEPGVSDAASTASFALRRPLIAVGAPASTIYPNVARRLDAELRLPPRFDVCNAVGAVVGLIAHEAVIRIEVNDDRFAVLMPEGPKIFVDFDKAKACAQEKASARARELAENDGAEDISLNLSETIKDYVDVTGERRIIDAVLKAEAIGRPPFGLHGG